MLKRGTCSQQHHCLSRQTLLVGLGRLIRLRSAGDAAGEARCGQTGRAGSCNFLAGTSMRARPALAESVQSQGTCRLPCQNGCQLTLTNTRRSVLRQAVLAAVGLPCQALLASKARTWPSACSRAKGPAGSPARMAASRMALNMVSSSAGVSASCSRAAALQHGSSVPHSILSQPVCSLRAALHCCGNHDGVTGHLARLGMGQTNTCALVLQRQSGKRCGVIGVSRLSALTCRMLGSWEGSRLSRKVPCACRSFCSRRQLASKSVAACTHPGGHLRLCCWLGEQALQEVHVAHTLACLQWIAESKLEQPDRPVMGLPLLLPLPLLRRRTAWAGAAAVAAGGLAGAGGACWACCGGAGLFLGGAGSTACGAGGAAGSGSDPAACWLEPARRSASRSTDVGRVDPVRALTPQQGTRSSWHQPACCRRA